MLKEGLPCHHNIGGNPHLLPAMPLRGMRSQHIAVPDMSGTAVSHHLRPLRNSGLTVSRRERKEAQ